MNTLKKLLKIILLGGLVGVFILAHFLLLDADQNVYEYEVVSTQYTVSEKQALDRSVNSSVRVMSLNKETLGFSTLSGTYMKFRGQYYVLTSAHGVIGDCDTLAAAFQEKAVPCEEIVAIDKETDYAIFRVGELEGRTPIRIPQALAHWRKSYNLLDKVYYTGYPNSVGPTTWTGTIAGFSGDYVILQSYAWSGASGSGVFDEHGELIGIIMAIDVGRSEFGYQVLNNFIIVVPVWCIDFRSALME